MLELKNISKSFGGVKALRNISAEFHEGEIHAILGENGAGKSTLMRTLLGLQRPLGGKISFGDGVKPGEIGYLPQQTAIQRDFPATVREVAQSGCQARLGRCAFYSRADKAMAAANLARMGMDGLGGRCYRELSGGQQQRVLLARALCAAEKLLLLDEPVSGLDPRATAEMYGLVEQLNREGMTVVMISHDIAAAVRYASHMLHIGDRIFFGTVGDYRKSARGRRFLNTEGGEDA